MQESFCIFPYAHKMQACKNDRARARGRGELDLLRQIRSQAAQSHRGGLRLGIGDDCALLSPRANEELAVTTDLSIASRHFRLDWHPAEAVGHRALARGLSDLAAMGARPVAAFLSLGLPRELTLSRGKQAAWVDRFLNGLHALAQSYETPLAGGDLAEAPIAVADIVLTGAVPRGKALLRSGARPGDLLYVTGALGGAANGLELLAQLAGQSGRSSTSSRPPRIPKKLEATLAPHLYPQPRIAQGLWLRRNGLASAALDLSDGLSTDLHHICEESGVAAEIDAEALPLHEGATLKQALFGGEDYELLFTAPATARIPKSIAGVAVTRIGRIVKTRSGRPEMLLVGPQGRQPLTPHGWEHFAK
jgi:thiamine-monophosphate kinase